MCSVNPLGGAGVGELTQVDGHVAVGAVHRRLETRHTDLRASQHSLFSIVRLVLNVRETARAF